jgi:twitching motility protein PilT
MTPSSSRLDSLLAACVKADASDLHLSPGLPPHLRVHGELMPLPETPPCAGETIAELAAELLRRVGAVHGPEALPRGSFDGAVTSPEGVRFRFNLFRRQAETAVALRRLEDRFRSLEELGLPETLRHFCHLRDGLVIVSGPTGAGKSTTLATLVDHINRSRRGHIITIEDPIEYLHRSVQCIVNQRQVGLDAPSFNDALVASLRQDPDVVLVGETRDLETIRTAITAAETGHLVLTTLHAGDCVGSIERLVSVFPADEQDGIRRQLALVLRGVVAQRLLPAAGQEAGRSRVACCEILMATPAVANLVATGRSAQIYSAMETGTGEGMQTFEQDLARLWVSRRITETTAQTMARHPQTLRERAAALRARWQGGPASA